MLKNFYKISLSMLILGGIFYLPGRASAVVHYGDTAPNFAKTQYNTAPAVTLTVNSYALKVRVFFLLGFN